jgi:hypothetical protein
MHFRLCEDVFGEVVGGCRGKVGAPGEGWRVELTGQGIFSGSDGTTHQRFDRPLARGVHDDCARVQSHLVSESGKLSCSVVAPTLMRRNALRKRKAVFLQAIGVRITPCRVTRRRAATVRERRAHHDCTCAG